MKNSKNFLLFFFASVVIVLLFISITRLNNTSVTFSSLLNYISNAPRLFTDFSIQDYSIVADWGLLNGLKDFFNIFTNIFGLIVFLGKSLVNMLFYVFYFVRYLF